MQPDILRKTESIDGIETHVDAWCRKGLWTVSVSQQRWRRSYQVDGAFSKARTYEEALSFAVKLATDREALRTPESDEKDRLEQLAQMARFRADSLFANDVRCYRAALRTGRFAAEVMQEWRRNLEARTDSSLSFAWLMEHMDRQHPEKIA